MHHKQLQSRMSWKRRLCTSNTFLVSFFMCQTSKSIASVHLWGRFRFFKANACMRTKSKPRISACGSHSIRSQFPTPLKKCDVVVSSAMHRFNKIPFNGGVLSSKFSDVRCSTNPFLVRPFSYSTERWKVFDEFEHHNITTVDETSRKK